MKRLASALSALGMRISAAFTKTEKVVLAASLVVFVLVHAVTGVPGFGEDDEARFAVDAIAWHLTGKTDFRVTDYRMRTSPMYIHALKIALDRRLPIRLLPAAMNGANLALSAIILGATYLLFRPLGGRGVAALTCALLAATPAAWLGASYGMAHVPALAAWLVALLVFASALEDGVSKVGYFGRIAGAVALGWIALSMKADLVLTGFAFPGLALAKGRFSPKNVAAACGVVLASTGIQLLYSRSVVSAEVAKGPEPVVDHLNRLNKRFPFELRGFWHVENVASITNAPGRLLFALAVFALFVYLVRRETARLSVWALAWCLPLMIFWVLVIGNSARHNLATLPPLLFLVARLLREVAQTRLRLSLLVGLVLVANYFSDVNGASLGNTTMVPRTDLLALSQGVNAGSAKIEKAAVSFAKRPDAMKGAVERFTLPWEQFQVAALGQRTGKLTYDGDVFRIAHADGAVQNVKLVYASHAGQASIQAQRLRTAGFKVFSHDYGMVDR
jgi:hypothetical protein